MLGRIVLSSVFVNLVISSIVLYEVHKVYSWFCKETYYTYIQEVLILENRIAYIIYTKTFICKREADISQFSAANSLYSKIVLRDQTKTYIIYAFYFQITLYLWFYMFAQAGSEFVCFFKKVLFKWIILLTICVELKFHTYSINCINRFAWVTFMNLSDADCVNRCIVLYHIDILLMI